MQTPVVTYAADVESLDDLFSTSVRSNPDRPALFVRGRPWSYSELNDECRAIQQSLAGKTRRNIGLVYAKSAFSYAAIIATMRSDNVYVPLNPLLPPERLQKILRDAQIDTIIIDSSDVAPDNVTTALSKCEPLEILCNRRMAGSSPTYPRQHTCRMVIPAEPGDAPTRHTSVAADTGPRLAYIMYTSGSTGTPKGVSISHQSARNFIEKLHRQLQTSKEDRFTQFSALSFDISILDMFLCWKSGGTLYPPASSESLVPLSFVVQHQLTVWSSVPSLANIMLKLGLLRANSLQSVRLALFCGEALPVELARAWSVAAPAGQVVNLYGPTEVTMAATYFHYDAERAPDGGTVPIGTPFPGVDSMIVADGSIVEKEGDCGELWLSGDQLAVGYWQNPEATEAAFVPFPPGDRTPNLWYRTGDLVSRHHAVGLCFRGRLDRQIKLRGYRIELQEVESALRLITGSALVAVIPIRGNGGVYEKLIAYCDRLPTTEAAVKAECSKHIPPYMVPEQLIELHTFPLNTSGKVDYVALTGSLPASGKQTAHSGIVT